MTTRQLPPEGYFDSPAVFRETIRALGESEKALTVGQLQERLEQLPLKEPPNRTDMTNVVGALKEYGYVLERSGHFSLTTKGEGAYRDHR